MVALEGGKEKESCSFKGVYGCTSYRWINYGVDGPRCAGVMDEERGGVGSLCILKFYRFRDKYKYCIAL